MAGNQSDMREGLNDMCLSYSKVKHFTATDIAELHLIWIEDSSCGALLGCQLMTALGWCLWPSNLWFVQSHLLWIMAFDKWLGSIWAIQVPCAHQFSMSWHPSYLLGGLGNVMKGCPVGLVCSNLWGQYFAGTMQWERFPKGFNCVETAHGGRHWSYWYLHVHGWCELKEISIWGSR